MGFLKRLFSIGSRRKKNKRLLADSISPSLGRIQEEEQEAAASRLLRSSSARFTVVSEVDYTNMPPMPHPINQIVQTPTSSSTTLPSTAQRSTFTVTVHRRTRHALTEFPNAYPPVPTRSEADGETPRSRREYTVPLFRPHDSLRTRSKSTPFPMTPRDANRLQRLRQDPSVASLVNLYDEHGCLPPNAFSNSPPSPPKERAQVRRNGSTLRQLLGDPKPRKDGEDNSGLEGDISWAERFLGETDANSSTSSLGQCLQTPTEFNTPLINDHPDHKHDNTTFPTDHDLSNANDTDSSANYPAFSSMEVEISIADSPRISASHHPTSPYQHENPMTPQRASQVFGFLTERRQSRIVQEGFQSTSRLSTPLPHTAFEAPFRSHFSDNSSEYNDSQDQEPSLLHAVSDYTQPNSHDCNPAIIFPHKSSCTPSRSASFTSDDNGIDDSLPSCDLPTYYPDGLNSWQRSDPHCAEVPTVGPTLDEKHDKLNHPSVEHAPNNRNKHGLNGPRAKPSRASRTDMQHDDNPEIVNDYAEGLTRNVLTDKPRQANRNDAPSRKKDPFTPMPSRRSKVHRRTASTSTLSLVQDSDVSEKWSATPRPAGQALENRVRQEFPILVGDAGKENGAAMNTRPDVPPKTPVRKNLRIPAGMPPSPASSSELSPVGRQLMTNLREQRMRGREAEKQRRIRLSTGIGGHYRW